MGFKNILIFGHSNIGDVIYDLAVVSPLKKAYPRAKISFLTSARSAGIAQNYQGLDRVIIFDRHKKNQGFIRRLRFTWDMRKEKFDLVCVLSASLNYLFMGIPRVWRLGHKVSKRCKHPVERYLYLLRLHAVAADKASFSFKVSKSDADFRDEFLQKKGILPNDRLVGILALAAWTLKSWPVAKWNKLAEILQDRWQVKMIQLGRLPENEVGKSIDREISKNIIRVGNRSLPQIKALIERCQLFIGPDSSLLHLASCLGTKVVGLYGATSWQHFYPYRHKENVVLAKKKLNCMPCCPGNQPVCTKEAKLLFGPCMDRIEVEDVLAIVKKQLNLN